MKIWKFIAPLVILSLLLSGCGTKTFPTVTFPPKNYYKDADDVTSVNFTNRTLESPADASLFLAANARCYGINVEANFYYPNDPVIIESSCYTRDGAKASLTIFKDESSKTEELIGLASRNPNGSISSQLRTHIFGGKNWLLMTEDSTLGEVFSTILGQQEF